MTGRSMSDEQMQERYGWDKEPWVCSHGKRFSSEPTACGRARFAPRRSCIPSPDPKPWLCAMCGQRYSFGETPDACFRLFRPRPWGEFTPDPEFVRTEVNPVLSAFRAYQSAGEWVTIAESVLDWLDYQRLAPSVETESFRAYWAARKISTPSQVAFARLVLTRLRDVMEANK